MSGRNPPIDMTKKRGGIVAIADVHAYNYHRFSTIDETGRTSRLNDIVRVVSWARDFAVSQDAAFLILGDLFHDRGKLDALVVNSFLEVVHDAVIVAGNHDQVSMSDENGESALRLFMSSNTLIEWPGFFRLPHGRILACVPYAKDPKLILQRIYTLTKLEYWQDTPVQDRVLAVHIGLKEESYRYNNAPECIALNQIPECAVALFGHFHEPSFFLDEEQLAVQLGAPIMHGFGDEDPRRGFTHVYWEDGNPHVDFHPITTVPQFVTIRRGGGNFTERVKGNYVRLIAPGEKVLKQWKEEAQEAGALGIEGYVQRLDTMPRHEDRGIKLTLAPSDALRSYMKTAPPPEEVPPELVEDWSKQIQGV